MLLAARRYHTRSPASGHARGHHSASEIERARRERAPPETSIKSQLDQASKGSKKDAILLAQRAEQQAALAELTPQLDSRQDFESGGTSALAKRLERKTKFMRAEERKRQESLENMRRCQSDAGPGGMALPGSVHVDAADLVDSEAILKALGVKSSSHDMSFHRHSSASVVTPQRKMRPSKNRHADAVRRAQAAVSF